MQKEGTVIVHKRQDLQQKWPGEGYKLNNNLVTDGGYLETSPF